MEDKKQVIKLNRIITLLSGTLRLSDNLIVVDVNNNVSQVDLITGSITKKLEIKAPFSVDEFLK